MRVLIASSFRTSFTFVVQYLKPNLLALWCAECEVLLQRPIFSIFVLDITGMRTLDAKPPAPMIPIFGKVPEFFDVRLLCSICML